MSGKELDLALRVHADLTQGSQALETLSETIVGVGEGAQQANSKLAETSRVIDDLGASGASASQQLGQVGESAEQQAQRIQAMVAASLQAQAAIQGAVATNQRLDDSLKANNANWQESADSQTAAMNEYHNAERALAAQAVAQQQAAEQAAAAAEAFEEQETALAKLLGQIDPVVRELGRLDQMEEQLRGFKASGILDPEGFDIYNAKVQEMRSRLGESADAMQDSTAATREQEAALARLQGQIDPVVRELNRLNQMEQQLRSFRDSGVLDQAGFDAYNRKLQEQRTRLTESSEAMRTAGMSAGQYRQAIQQLAAQLTDVATSLATGMPLWMVAIQQGGQIVDSFGGVENSLKLLGQQIKSFFGITSAGGNGVASLGAELADLAAEQVAVAKGSAQAGESLSDMAESANNVAEATNNAKEGVSFLHTTGGGLAIVFTLAAAAAVALAFAYKQGSDEADQLNESIILTGNYAGTSAGQLQGMAASLAKVNGTQHEAVAALAEINNTGKFTVDQLQQVATTAIAMQDATGKAVSDTVAEFVKLADDPVKAVQDLNSKYHFLTAAVNAQITALYQEGDALGAAQVAMDAYSKAMDERATKITDNLGIIEKSWKAIQDGAKSAWDEMLGVGRSESPEERLQSLAKGKSFDLGKLAANGAVLGPLGAAWEGYQQYKNMTLSDEERAALAAPIQQEIEARDAKARQEGERARIEQQATKAQGAMDGLLESVRTNKEKRDKLNKQLDRDIAAIQAANPNDDRLKPENIAKAREAIDQKYKDPKQPKTPTTHLDNTDVTAAKNQLEQLQADFKNSQANLDAQQKAGLLSYSDYVAKRSDLIREEKDAVTAAYQQQIAALEELRNKSTTNASQRIDLDQKIAQSRSDMVKAQKKADSDLSVLLTNEQGRLIKEAQAVKTYTDALRQQYDALVQQGARAAASVGMGANQRNLFEQQSNLDDRLAQQRLELASQYGDGARGMSLDEYNAKVQALESNHAAMTQQLRSNYAELQVAQADWTNGASAAFADYVDSANNAAGQTYQLFSNAFGGVEDALVEAVTTGKLSFDDLLQTVSQDLARMAIRALEVKAIGGLMGMFGGGGEEASGSGLSSGAAAVTASAGALSIAGGTLLTGAAAIEAAAVSLAAANTGSALGASSGSSSSGSTGWFGMAASAISSYYGGGSTSGYATGGHVLGPGTDTSDSIRADLSNYEYVTRAAVVRQPGALPFLHDFNARGMVALDDWASRVRHATGGLAGVPAPAMPAPAMPGGRPADLASKLSTNVTNRLRIINAQDPEDAVRRQAETPAFEKAILNIIGNNPSAVKELLS